MTCQQQQSAGSQQIGGGRGGGGGGLLHSISRPAEELEEEAWADDGVEEQQEGGHDGIGSPEHADEQGGEDQSPVDQLPDSDRNGDGEQDEHDNGQPDVAQGGVLQLAPALGGGLEGDVLARDLADE